jgi:hypothetical protein
MSYVSQSDGNLNNPPNTSVQWAPLNPDGVSIQAATLNGGAWISGNRYMPDQIVYYTTPNETGNAGNYYICIADTVGSPAVPPSLAAQSRQFWLPLDSSTFLGTWNNAARYDRDNVASLNGVFYQSTTDNNVNNNPQGLSSSQWSAYGFKGSRIAFLATQFINNGSLASNTPTTLKSILAANLSNLQYNYARGFGYALITGGTYASAPTYSLYLSESATGAVPTNNSAAISYISYVAPSNVVANIYFDLSALSYFNVNGFANLYLVISSSTGGTGVTIIPVGATVQGSQGTGPLAQPTITIGTVATQGVSGLEFFRAPFSVI